jgi:hypothetical protein
VLPQDLRSDAPQYLRVSEPKHCLRSDSLLGGIRAVTDPPGESSSMPRNGHRREGGSRFERFSRRPSRMQIFEMKPRARWQVAAPWRTGSSLMAGWQPHGGQAAPWRTGSPMGDRQPHGVQAASWWPGSPMACSPMAGGGAWGRGGHAGRGRMRGGGA